MKTKKKSFDAVAESRKWRIEMGRRLNAMPLAERLAYLARERERYAEKQPGLAASFAKSAAHEEPDAPKPAKAFDAVAESRKWKEAVTRETASMSRAEVLEFFNSSRTASSHLREYEETCVVREEPPKA
ncbi:MAG: hypothetical protein ABMA01_20415 [Chthoniobacteraceae bacterium]